MLFAIAITAVAANNPSALLSAYSPRQIEIINNFNSFKDSDLFAPPHQPCNGASDPFCHRFKISYKSERHTVLALTTPLEICNRIILPQPAKKIADATVNHFAKEVAPSTPPNRKTSPCKCWVRDPLLGLNGTPVVVTFSVVTFIFSLKENSPS